MFELIWYTILAVGLIAVTIVEIIDIRHKNQLLKELNEMLDAYDEQCAQEEKENKNDQN